MGRGPGVNCLGAGNQVSEDRGVKCPGVGVRIIRGTVGGGGGGRTVKGRGQTVRRTRDQGRTAQIPIDSTSHGLGRHLIACSFLSAFERTVLRASYGGGSTLPRQVSSGCESETSVVSSALIFFNRVVNTRWYQNQHFDMILDMIISDSANSSPSNIHDFIYNYVDSTYCGHDSRSLLNYYFDSLAQIKLSFQSNW